MDYDPIINGGLAFAAVLALMALNIPIGISMLVVGFIGFAFISGFDPAILVLGFAPYEAVTWLIALIYQETYMMLLMP